MGDTLEGGVYSSRNLEAECAAPEVSPVIVMVRFRQDLSGEAGGGCVAARFIEGWGVLDRGMAGRGDAGQGVLGRFGDNTSPPSMPGNETLGIIGVEG